MKKLSIGALVLAICLVFTGCGQGGDITGTWKEDYFEKICPESNDKMQYHTVVFYDDGSFEETRFFKENGRFVSDSVSGSYGDYGRQIHTGIMGAGGSVREEKVRLPVLDSLPGKFERYGGWDKSFRFMTRGGNYYYRVSGDTLYITDLRVGLDTGMGSTLSGQYSRVW